MCHYLVTTVKQCTSESKWIGMLSNFLTGYCYQEMHLPICTHTLFMFMLRLVDLTVETV